MALLPLALTRRSAPPIHRPDDLDCSPFGAVLVTAGSGVKRAPDDKQCGAQCIAAGAAAALPSDVGRWARRCDRAPLGAVSSQSMANAPAAWVDGCGEGERRAARVASNRRRVRH